MVVFKARREPPVAEEILGGSSPRLLHLGIVDSEAWDVGLRCGGEIDVFVERYEP